MAEIQKDRSEGTEDDMVAGPLMVAWLVSRLGVTLAPCSMRLPNGTRLDIDAASDDPPILCQASRPAGLVADAFKLLVARRLLGDHRRLILVVNARELMAEEIMASRSWFVGAAAAGGIEVIAADVELEASDDVHQSPSH